jgi:hypothetical protein
MANWLPSNRDSSGYAPGSFAKSKRGTNDSFDKGKKTSSEDI